VKMGMMERPFKCSLSFLESIDIQLATKRFILIVYTEIVKIKEEAMPSENAA
jgi:hypothetical protein